MNRYTGTYHRLGSNPRAVFNMYRSVPVWHRRDGIVVVSVRSSAPCDMHTLLPITTLSRLSIQHASPSQQWSPMVRFHGDLMMTLFFITSPFPIFAPNMRSNAILIPINGFHEALTIKAFTSNSRQLQVLQISIQLFFIYPVMVSVQIKRQITNLPQSDTGFQQMSADMNYLMKRGQGRRHGFYPLPTNLHKERLATGKLFINNPLKPLMQSWIFKQAHIIMQLHDIFPD